MLFFGWTNSGSSAILYQFDYIVSLWWYIAQVRRTVYNIDLRKEREKERERERDWQRDRDQILPFLVYPYRQAGTFSAAIMTV